MISLYSCMVVARMFPGESYWCDVIIQDTFNNKNGTLNCLGVCMLYYLADG